jgi:hypothetical protein
VAQVYLQTQDYENKVVDLSTFCGVQFFARATAASGGELTPSREQSLLANFAEARRKKRDLKA